MDRQVVRYQRDDQEFGRAIGFFDATYALALTLLVTTLAIPEPSSAWASLPALWDVVGPQFLAFGISFAVIASYWLAPPTRADAGRRRSADDHREPGAYRVDRSDSVQHQRGRRPRR